MSGNKTGTALKTGDRRESGRGNDTTGRNRTLIAVIIVILASAVIIGMIVLSHPAAPGIPHLEAVISYDSTTRTVIFTHNGGDPLTGPVWSLSVADANGVLIPNTSPLIVYNTDGSEDSAHSWSLGKSIRYTLDPSAGIPSSAQVRYMGPSPEIIASTRFTPVIITVPSFPAPSPATTNLVTTNTTLPHPQEPLINGSPRRSTVVVSQAGTSYPVRISYITDSAGSGSDSVPFTLSRAGPANSSFGVTLTAPLRDCSGSGCMGAPRYFSHWSASGVVSSEPTINFTVLDNASWAATAVYSESLPCHCIGGRIWEDYTMDGVMDPGEPILAGWTVSLFRQEGKSEVFVDSTTTDSEGAYQFLDIPYSDRFAIREDLKSGWVQSYPRTGRYQNETLSFASRCRVTDLNFGNREILVAGFSGEPTSGPAPLTVHFRDLSTGTAQSWSWNFGDGYASSRQDPEYTYLTAGTYGVSLSVANTYGQNHQLQKAGYITVTPPVTTMDLVLDTAKAGYITAGGIVQFRVTGSNSYVQIGSTRYTLNATDRVRMVVRSDSAGSIYLSSASSLTSFSLPDVDLYINGGLKKTGEVSAIYISALDQFSSSLRLIIPAKGGTMSLTAGGNVIESGINTKSLKVLDISPDSSFHSINLDANTYRVTYNGGATAYSLS